MELLSPVLQSPLVRFSGPLLTICIIAFFWWRAGSFYTLLELAWRLTAGKVEVVDQELKNFIQATREVEKFRFMFGIKVRSLGELHKVVRWIDRYSVDVVLAQKAKRWIDVRLPEMVIEPPAGYVNLRLGQLAVCGLFLTIFSQLSLYDVALLQTKESKVWFYSDAKTINHVTNDWEVTPNKCEENRKEVMRFTGFTETEVEASCQALKGGELKELVRKTIHFQKVLLGFLAASTIFLLALIIFKVMAANAAIEIRNTIARIPENKDEAKS